MRGQLFVADEVGEQGVENFEFESEERILEIW